LAAPFTFETLVFGFVSASVPELSLLSAFFFAAFTMPLAFAADFEGLASLSLSLLEELPLLEELDMDSSSSLLLETSGVGSFFLLFFDTFLAADFAVCLATFFTDTAGLVTRPALVFVLSVVAGIAATTLLDFLSFAIAKYL